MSKMLLEFLVATLVMLIAGVIYFMVFDDFMNIQQTHAAQLFRKRAREKAAPKAAGKQHLMPRRGVLGAQPVSFRAGAADSEHNLTHGGRERRFVVHVPRGYDGLKSLPVVLGFHGGGGRAESLQKQSRLNEVSDRHGFLAVYPDGTGRARLYTWNAGTCCGLAVRENVDDVGFVRAMVEELDRLYHIDRGRIFATGISNGAMFTYRLACEASDLIAGIGPVSGDMGVDGPRPSRPVPVIHFHGLKDPNCPYLGGIGPNAVTKVPHRPIPETIAWWVQVNNCQPKPIITNDRDFVRESYAPAPGQKGSPVVLYKLLEGGHTWPGGVDLTPRFGTGKLIESVDAGTIMWTFFEKLPSHDAVPVR
jgi:polyhydroxybutyrate depolymerase